MCRLYGFRANEKTKVECSLVHAQNALLRQSQSDALGRSHADGWGLAYYENSHPTVVRRRLAAFEDLHFSHTAEKIYSNTVVAHVRLATVGEARVENSHPFHYGCWAFAHNGTVREFDKVRKWMLDETEPWLRALRGGDTDSEHVFYWLLSRINAHGIGLEQRRFEPEVLIDIVADSVDTIADWCKQAGAQQETKLNFILTDGRVLIGTRFNHTLYYARRKGYGIANCVVSRTCNTMQRPTTARQSSLPKRSRMKTGRLCPTAGSCLSTKSLGCTNTRSVT
ncbi:MAG: class II glutamine amidotransferase [Rhodopirellula sp.]|nr:class II glutamine amidotransferase [Rhodopirellula sp.]